MNLVVEENNELDTFLRKGEISQAAQVAMSVLRGLNEKSTCEQELSSDVKQQISNTLVAKFKFIQPESLEMSRTVLTVIRTATGEQAEEACENCEDTMSSTVQMTDTIINLLAYTLNDPEEPFTAELHETGTSVAGCLSNVLRSSSRSSQGNMCSRENVQSAFGKIQSMSDAFLGRLVTGEIFVIRTTELKTALKKVSPDDAKGLNMAEGDTSFQLPGDLGSLGNGSVNAKMTAVNFNPFTWDNSSNAIQSIVTSLELHNGNSGKINVSNLNEEIVLIIPIHSASSNYTHNISVEQHSFLKPHKLSYRSYNAELADVPVTIKIGVDVGVALEILVKFGSRPTVENFDHNFTITFDSTCESRKKDKQNMTSCVLENSTVVLPPKPGPIYVGLLYLGATNSTEHLRKKRSCFGHGRQRRACVGFKDPPPKGVLKTVVPQYDQSTDLKYTLVIIQSACMYWSENKSKWSSDGCKVDPRSNLTHLVCRCNHLTSFGGNFIQAPNPIDFDKVFAEFGNLSESGNVAVLVTIVVCFLLYLVVIVFVRRADKRDEDQICPPKQVTIVNEGNYFYDIVIATGVWKNSGTTANVSLSIRGEMNELNQISLRNKRDSRAMFARGSMNGFLLITDTSLGPLTQISLVHDNFGDNPSWFVETVTIRDRQTNKQWVFQMNRWLAVERDDGEIDVTADHNTSTSFSSQVRSRFGRKLADSHLWMSVFGKSCSSTFTRVQRASCCLSILFSAMIANAMFYNIGGESEGAIQIGPFKFSWRQIVIGVQSGLIIAPINILIVFLFKSSKPKSKKADRYKDVHLTQQLVDQVKDTGCMLPHFCVYFAWFLCFVTTLTAATFTLFYSLSWGKEVSEQWLSSIMISNGQDIFAVQPTKVMLTVVVVALLLTRTRSSRDATEDSDRTDTPEDEFETDFLCDNPKERFKRLKLEAIRKRTKKEVKLAGILKDAVLHLTFVFLLSIVCYGNKNSHRYMMTSTLLNPFSKFGTVTERQRLLGWMRQVFLPNVFNQPWYNGRDEKDDVYVENKMSVLIGMPWMRQLRIKTSSCNALPSFVAECHYDYSSGMEDTTTLSLPGWKRLPFNTSFPTALRLCPKPWRYQTAEELGSYPMTGTFNSYEGGGYVAVMGYDQNTALGVLGETFGYGWVDHQTRAVILEFAVFNANTNLLSIATYFYEALASGAAFTTRRVHTLELYSTESGALMFYLICQFLFMAMVLYYLIMLLIHLYRQRLAFFKLVWNMVDFFMIVFSVLSVAFYMIRARSVLKSVKAIQNNPYDIVHFHTAINWFNLENVAIAFAIFMVTFKLLNLIRFNPYVIYLFSSFRQSVGYQLSYVVFFLLIFHAFLVSGHLIFGHIVFEYSSYTKAVISQFQFLLGKAVPLDALRRENRFLGPSFALAYNMTMTIVLMNMLVSVLNESYTDARTQAEDSAEELEMARFIGENFTGLLKKSQKGNDIKLYCDESTYVNMCHSDAEPFCLNSQSIKQCSKERHAKLEKRLSALSRRTGNIEVDYRREEDEFLVVLFAWKKSHLRKCIRSEISTE